MEQEKKTIYYQLRLSIVNLYDPTFQNGSAGIDHLNLKQNNYGL